VRSLSVLSPLSQYLLIKRELHAPFSSRRSEYGCKFPEEVVELPTFVPSFAEVSLCTPSPGRAPFLTIPRGFYDAGRSASNRFMKIPAFPVRPFLPSPPSFLPLHSLPPDSSLFEEFISCFCLRDMASESLQRRPTISTFLRCSGLEHFNRTQSTRPLTSISAP